MTLIIHVSETCLVVIVFDIIVKQVLLIMPAEHLSTYRELCSALQDFTDSFFYQQIEFSCQLVMMLVCEWLWKYVCLCGYFMCVIVCVKLSKIPYAERVELLWRTTHSQSRSQRRHPHQRQSRKCLVAVGGLGDGRVCGLVGCWS